MNKLSNKKSVLIVLYYYYPYVSGLTIHAQRIAEGLVASGHQVTVLTSKHEKSLLAKEYFNGVKIIRRPVLFKLSKGVVMPLFWLDVIRYARHHDYVNPHLPMPDTAISSLFIPKKKIITNYICDINLVGGLVSKFIVLASLWLEKLQLLRSRTIVTLSLDYFRHSKMKNYLNKAVEIAPPIPSNTFNKTDSAKLQRKLGVNPKQIKIGFVGRVVYEKGISYLLKSIPYLIEQLPADFVILIAGDYKNIAGGSIKSQLDEYVQKYPEHITFTGYLKSEELIEFYSLIDVLVLPSIDPLEAFGMVQVEALLCGCPVIASDMPGVRTVIQKLGYGLLSKTKDPKDIAQKVVKVINNKRHYIPNRDRVSKIYNQNSVIDAYVKLMP